MRLIRKLNAVLHAACLLCVPFPVQVPDFSPNTVNSSPLFSAAYTLHFPTPFLHFPKLLASLQLNFTTKTRPNLGNLELNFFSRFLLLSVCLSVCFIVERVIVVFVFRCKICDSSVYIVTNSDAGRPILGFCVSIYLPTYLPTHLPTYIPACISIYLTPFCTVPEIAINLPAFYRNRNFITVFTTACPCSYPNGVFAFPLLSLNIHF